MKAGFWVFTVTVAFGSPSVSGQMPFTLADVSFLTGCWTGDMGSLDMREQWSDADGGVMLGSTRYLREGRVVDWEFALLRETEAGVTLWPYPQGEPSTDGFPLIKTDSEYVFENLAHDFPVRIVYVRSGEDELSPRIEGRDGQARRWSLRRAPCTG